jgi:hypothetical protein
MPSHHKEKHIVVEVDDLSDQDTVEAEIHKALSDQPIDEIKGKSSKELLIVVREEGN